MKINEVYDGGSETIFYFPSYGETLASLEEKFGVPAHVMIRDNLLESEYIEGLSLLIDRSRGRAGTLLPDEPWDEEELERKNGTDVFYPFQKVYK